MKVLVFLGSARASSPPKPQRLGLRVSRACTDLLERHGAEVELIDPLDLAFEPVFKPHFSYPKGEAPDALESLAKKIVAADAYVMVSPEYNHSISPALAHMLNHFGSSQFGFKPSAIVTYSAGQWGGARAAISLRPFLSELGCLPVSAMVHIPKAQEVFAEDGSYLEGVDGANWDKYIGRTLAQLAWWADAARVHREAQDPLEQSPVFNREPSQRNAP